MRGVRMWPFPADSAKLGGRNIHMNTLLVREDICFCLATNAETRMENPGGLGATPWTRTSVGSIAGSPYAVSVLMMNNSLIFHSNTQQVSYNIDIDITEVMQIGLDNFFVGLTLPLSICFSFHHYWYVRIYSKEQTWESSAHIMSWSFIFSSG